MVPFLVLALAASVTVVAQQLYGVKSYDPFAIGAALTVLVSSAAVTVLISARHAAVLDALAALRCNRHPT